MHGTPIDIEQIKRDFRGEVRLFPQPSLVIFPDGFAPLQVFEERYVQLMRDAAEDDKLVALALLEPNWESEYGESPPVFPTVTIGRILQFHQGVSLPGPGGKLSGGQAGGGQAAGGLASGGFGETDADTPQPASLQKCDALLYGLFRARVRREVADFPYRRAEVEILDEVQEPAESEEIAARVHRALDLVPGRKSIIWEMRRMATQLRGLDAAAGRYADAVADASDLQPADRYELLAEPNVLRRLERLIEMLEQRAYSGTPAIPPGTQPHLN